MFRSSQIPTLTTRFTVHIYEDDWLSICESVAAYNDIETGGDLFGFWETKNTALIKLALGAGKNRRRTKVSFFQDMEYSKKVEEYLAKKIAGSNVGLWYSHHRMNKPNPTMEENNIIWRKMNKLRLDKYIVFIAIINSSDVVKIECFLFQIKKSGRSINLGKLVLHQKSPLRLEDSIMNVITSGAERIKLSPSAISAGTFEKNSNCTNSVASDVEDKDTDQEDSMNVVTQSGVDSSESSNSKIINTTKLSPSAISPGAFEGNNTCSCTKSTNLMPDSKDEAKDQSQSDRKKWKFIKTLGNGGYGEVSLFHDKNGKEVAGKKFYIAITCEKRKEELVKSLKTEVTVLSSIKHERVVSYFEMGRSKTSVYLFMEYLPGGSVYDYVKQHGPLSESLTSRYTRQILQGVEYLHSRHIIHRDIKGANILRCENGDIKLADFGNSNILETITTVSGLYSNFVGTVYWMAPEIIDGKRHGTSADLWSIGCTVVEMLRGKPPFAKFEPVVAMYQICFCEIEHELPPEVSKDARNFVERTVVKDPGLRPKATELLLHPFVRQNPVTCTLVETKHHDGNELTFVEALHLKL